MMLRVNNTQMPMGFRINGFDTVQVMPAPNMAQGAAYSVPVAAGLSAAELTQILDERLEELQPTPSQNPLLIVTTTLNF